MQLINKRGEQFNYTPSTVLGTWDSKAITYTLCPQEISLVDMSSVKCNQNNIGARRNIYEVEKYIWGREIYMGYFLKSKLSMLEDRGQGSERR